MNWIETASLGVNVITALVIWWAYYGGEKRRDGRMQAAINEKFALQSVESRNAVTLQAQEGKAAAMALHAVVNEIKTRLEKGDGKFDHQGDALHRLELKMVATLASKDELAAYGERLGMIENRFARLEGEIHARRH